VISESSEGSVLSVYCLIAFTSYITVTEFIVKKIPAVNSLASTVCAASGCNIWAIDSKTCLCFCIFVSCHETSTRNKTDIKFHVLLQRL
jgi:hypothetical protein